MRKLLLVCTALCSVQGATTCAADTDGKTKPDKGLADIVVTARRISENLQNVPVAITAITSATIANNRITTVSDLGNNIPNVSFQTQFGEPATPFITIRGFSNGTLNPSVDSPIGLYVDDVYIGRAVGSAFDLADLDQIEVLRGPQGTLFGRNATGGAISMHTKAPTGVFDGKVEGTVGNFNLWRVKAMIDLPTVANIAARISYVHSENDGPVKNSGPKLTLSLPAPFPNSITTSDTFGASKEDAVNVALRYTGVDKLTVNGRFDFSHLVQSQLATQGLGCTQAEAFQCLLVADSKVPYGTSVHDSLPLSVNTPGTLKTLGGSLTAIYDFSPAFSIKSISALRGSHEWTGGNEIDGGLFTGSALTNATIGIPAGTPWSLIWGFAKRDQTQVSQELQLIGHKGGLEWIMGGYYFREVGGQNAPIMSGFFGTGALTSANLLATVGTPATYSLGGLDHVNNRSFATYAHFTDHVTDDVTIAGGLRYTNDHKIYDNLYLGTRQVFTSGNTDWDASVTYKFATDQSVYAKVATAYLAGGALGGFTFQPEHNTSYELGYRSQWFNRMIRFNLTGFYETVQNQQITEFDATHGSYIINSSGNLYIAGVEAELAIHPARGTNFNVTYGHQSTPVTTNVVTGARAPSLYPADNFSVNGSYDSKPVIGDAYLSFSVDATFTSRITQMASLATNPTDAALFRLASTAPEWQVNGRLGLVDLPLGSTKGKISFWAKNLLNNRNVAFARDVFTVVGQFEMPRTYGMDLSVKF
jgi:iron complex outermembrane receptor protein